MSCVYVTVTSVSYGMELQVPANTVETYLLTWNKEYLTKFL